MASRTTTSTTTTTTSMGALNSSNNAHKEALMKKLGGKDMLHAAVDKFYDKLAADPMLAPFFQGSDINLLKWHQFNMMSIAFSFVPESFDVEELILKKHARFFDVGLTCVHFDRVVRHFENTLHELGVADKIVQEAITILLPLREVFEKGVLEAEARRRAVLRNHILKTATVTAICGAGLTFLWMSRHHGRFTKHRS